MEVHPPPRQSSGRPVSDRRGEVWHPCQHLAVADWIAAGNLITAVDPDKLFGAAFAPLVSIAAAIILAAMSDAISSDTGPVAAISLGIVMRVVR